MHRLLHQGGSLLHLLQADVHGAGDIDENTLGTLNAGLQQGAGNGHTGSLLGLSLAGGAAYAHMGQAGILHHSGDIGKIQIDKAGISDQV